MNNYYITGLEILNYVNNDGRNVEGLKVYTMSDFYCEGKGFSFTEFYVSISNPLYSKLINLDFANNIYSCDLQFSINKGKIKLKSISNITELPLL